MYKCCFCDCIHLHSFPTRRSSDLIPFADKVAKNQFAVSVQANVGVKFAVSRMIKGSIFRADFTPDRKSTRLNSSHQIISYAVFHLKKKKRTSAPFAAVYVHCL